MDFLYTTPPTMVTWQAPELIKFQKFVFKFFKENFGSTCKNHIDWICSYFFTNFVTIRGDGTSPQMPLTVKYHKISKLLMSAYVNTHFTVALEQFDRRIM